MQTYVVIALKGQNSIARVLSPAARRIKGGEGNALGIVPDTIYQP